MKSKTPFIQFIVLYLTLYLGVLLFTNIPIFMKVIIFIPETIFILSFIGSISASFNKKIEELGMFFLTLGLIFTITLTSNLLSLVTSMYLLVLVEYKDIQSFFDIFESSELTIFANYFVIFIGIVIVISYYIFKIIMFFFLKIKHKDKIIFKVHDKHVKFFNAGTVLFGFIPIMTSLLISFIEKSQNNEQENLKSIAEQENAQIFTIANLNSEVNEIIFVSFFMCLIPYLLFNKIPKSHLN